MIISALATYFWIVVYSYYKELKAVGSSDLWNPLQSMNGLEGERNTEEEARIAYGSMGRS